MAKYIVKNELNAFEFEFAQLRRISKGDEDLTFGFDNAIVVGNRESDWLKFLKKESCSLNPGPDRYAVPELSVTFKNYEIIDILTEESVSIDHGTGEEIRRIPAYHFTESEISLFWDIMLISPHSLVSYLGYYEDTNMIYMAFQSFDNPELNRDGTLELWLVAEEIQMAWENYGDSVR